MCDKLNCHETSSKVAPSNARRPNWALSVLNVFYMSMVLGFHSTRLLTVATPSCFCRNLCPCQQLEAIVR
jgi:hypothetical protein